MGKDKEESNKKKTRIVTPIFRVSYPHVFKPNTMNEDNPKYSIVMLFPKNSDLTELKNAIRQAKIQKWGPKEDWPEKLESPVSDGDSPNYADKEGYKGHWVIKATSHPDQKPTVVDENVEPMTSQNPPDGFYAGCYARACIFARPWKWGKKEGIQFILDHVQKVKNGKPFSSKQAANEVFNPIAAGDDEDDAGEENEDF
jgi:hypothetical protein